MLSYALVVLQKTISRAAESQVWPRDNFPGGAHRQFYEKKINRSKINITFLTKKKGPPLVFYMKPALLPFVANF